MTALILYYSLSEILSGSYISVGLVSENYENNVHPGWDAVSYAYHGDIGWAFHNIGNGLPFAPRFGTGDIGTFS